MRRSHSLWIIPAVVALLCGFSALAQSPVASETAVIKYIDSFYRFYITQNAGKPDKKKLATAVKKNCTAAFLKKMNAPGIDADLLVNAQDFDQAWLNTLQVTAAGKNTYSVCFQDNYTHKPHCVKVFMKIENSQWKINNVQAD